MDQSSFNFIHVGIIADDLTSAADGGSPFVKKGLSVEVLRGSTGHSLATESKVVAVDCGSRSTTAGDAAKRVAHATSELASAPILYKTIDSTLRGHVREELAAAYKSSRRNRIVIAPAFPDAGRTTINGIQYVDGVPVSDSSYANDPVHPATTSRITDLISSELNGVVILDAESQGDLDTQVAAVDNPESVLWVGSPGLANALAKTVACDTSRQILQPVAEQTLIVVGSANKVSRDQARRAEQMAIATCITVAEERKDDPNKVLADVVDKAVSALADPRIAAIIATGGDTMQALLDKLGVYAFGLIGEFEPGFPIGHTRLDNGRSLFLGMKAGGFGNPETLRSAVEYLYQNM